MYERKLVELALTQHNRVSRRQLLELGMGEGAITRRVAGGRLLCVEEGVFAVAPVLPGDRWGRWMEVTLTAPNTVLSRLSAANAFEVLSTRPRLETVTRPGNGGPRRHGGIVVYRSLTLAGETTTLRGVPITTMARTLLDLAASPISRRSLARAVREAVRLGHITVPELADVLIGCRRRGARRLRATVKRYSGLPIERARSGAEIRAMEILRSADRPLPRLNHRVAGEEADLSWPQARIIVEIDGGPFHLDIGQDAHKQARWEGAGWQVRRLSSADVYERPTRLLRLAPH